MRKERFEKQTVDSECLYDCGSCTAAEQSVGIVKWNREDKEWRKNGI